MAAEEADTGDGHTESDAEWLSGETLREQQDTGVAVLPKSGAKVKFRLMPPEKFGSLVDEYGIAELATQMGDVDPDGDLSNPRGVDLDNVEPSDLDDLDENFKIMLFFRDVILPQIDRPEKVHWCNPDHINDPEWVDLSEVPSEDKMFLVAKITGQDPDQLMEAAEDRMESFQE